MTTQSMMNHSTNANRNTGELQYTKGPKSISDKLENTNNQNLITSELESIRVHSITGGSQWPSASVKSSGPLVYPWQALDTVLM